MGAAVSGFLHVVACVIAAGASVVAVALFVRGGIFDIPKMFRATFIACAAWGIAWALS